MFKSLIFSLIIMSSSLVFAKQSVTLYGDVSYPPYCFKNNGAAAGIYVDVLKEAFKTMPGYEVEIKLIPWKRALALVKAGDGFGVFPPYRIKERESWLNFSEPIIDEQVLVFGTAENLAGKNKWPDDFMGTKFGLNRGFNPISMGGKAFNTAGKTGKLTIIEANTSEQNLNKLNGGRIDFYLYDRMIDISAYPNIKRGMVVQSNSGYVGFTRKVAQYPYADDFKQKLDKAIKDLKASGKIKAIIKKHKK